MAARSESRSACEGGIDALTEQEHAVRKTIARRQDRMRDAITRGRSPKEGPSRRAEAGPGPYEAKALDVRSSDDASWSACRERDHHPPLEGFDRSYHSPLTSKRGRTGVPGRIAACKTMLEPFRFCFYCPHHRRSQHGRHADGRRHVIHHIRIIDELLHEQIV